MIVDPAAPSPPLAFSSRGHRRRQRPASLPSNQGFPASGGCVVSLSLLLVWIQRFRRAPSTTAPGARHDGLPQEVLRLALEPVLVCLVSLPSRLGANATCCCLAPSLSLIALHRLRSNDMRRWRRPRWTMTWMRADIVRAGPRSWRSPCSGCRTPARRPCCASWR